MTGHARFGAGRPADLVVFSVSSGPDAGRIVGLGQPVSTPALRLYSLDFEFANPEVLRPGDFHRWTAVIDPGRLPPGDVVLNAWALDVQRMSLTPLADSLRIRRNADPAAPGEAAIIPSTPGRTAADG